ASSPPEPRWRGPTCCASNRKTFWPAACWPLTPRPTTRRPERHAADPGNVLLPARLHRRGDRRPGPLLGGQRLGAGGRVHRRPAPPQRLLGDVGPAVLRHPRRRGGGGGGQPVPADVPRPLHPALRLRRQARPPDDGPGLHRQPPEERARLPPRPHRGPRPHARLHDVVLRRRRASRPALQRPPRLTAARPLGESPVKKSRNRAEDLLRRPVGAPFNPFRSSEIPVPRFPRTAAIAAVALTTLAACGGAATKSATPATTSTTAAPTPLELVLASSHKVAATHTMRFSMTM